MCGIVYYNRKDGKNVSKLVRGAYKAQRSRGYQGFGFFTPNNNRLTHNVDERSILRLLNSTKQSEILFHHRFPTSTENVRNACHPFSSKKFYTHNYVMVHNGVIWNDLDVAKEQLEHGVKYISKQHNGQFNDSEVLLYDLADVVEGKKEELDCEGSIAFIMVQLDKKGNKEALYFGRNSGSPLKIKKFRHGFSLTSEGDGELVDTNTLFKYDYNTGKFSQQPLTIPSSSKWTEYKLNDTDWKYRGYGNDWERDYEPKKETWQKIDDNWINLTTGKVYDKHGNRIKASVGYEIPKQLGSVSFVENALERNKNLYAYTDTDDNHYQDVVKEVKNALMYDVSYDTETAIEFGEYLMLELNEKAETYNTLLLADEVSSDEWEQIMQLDTMQEILGKVLKELRNGQLQLALKSGLKEL